ncbi:drug resistance transporter, EmrB/QacA subfamily [Friedmanniella luteola]|uniref:Drug resistance transporter, EmrB/QacA subfamily n=1 Tax=Friedmanniella luteola TaxID=546871 RepID=A0A1H1Z4B6_9ACTN|nr:MFS transporter [Friedmanniella luteola]SDT28449.1 drug resistance transporter, EmrB/QacA subfamily [Friedmanniella luteola]
MTVAPTGLVRAGTRQGRWVLLATIAGSGLAQLDGTVVNVALAAIGRDLDAGFTALQWVVNAYTLTLAALILLGGVLGDLYGRRRVFLVGVVWFAVASALCALAPGEEVLIAARALQGVGGALLTPGSLAIISASFVPQDRARAVGAWSGLGGIAGAVGPFLGGWLVGLDWRWVFLVNLPVAALIVVVTLRHVPESRDEEVVAGTGHVDLPGTVLVVLALGGLTYALTEAGRSGWHPVLVGAGLLGLVAGAAFVVVERRAAQPLVRLDMFTDRVFAATNLVTVFVYAALAVYFFLIVLQLQVVSGWGPLAAGTAVLPVTACMLLLSARAGAAAQRHGPRTLMTLGCLLAGAGFVAALRIGPGADFLTDVLPSVLLLGLGLSCAVAPLTAAVLAAVLAAAPDHLAGAASGINNATARSAGLLAIAVVPAVAGLGGAGVDDAAALGRGFVVAMLIGAGLLAVGAVVSWAGLGRAGRHLLA